MTGLRTYEDPCGIARALDVVGERWALLIVRELVLGPKRFSDLRAALGASPNVLSQRLAELEAGEVVRQRTSGAALYELTDWGHELRPILLEFSRWGARARHRPAGELSVDALMLALESAFLGEQAENVDATYEIRLGEERFTIVVRDRRIALARGAPQQADVVIQTDAAMLRKVAFGYTKLKDAPVELRGDGRLGRAFFRLFAKS